MDALVETVEGGKAAELTRIAVLIIRLVKPTPVSPEDHSWKVERIEKP